jgi:hypothetical protein
VHLAEANRKELSYSAGVQKATVTDCFGTGAWDISDTEAVFVWGLLSLMKLVIPAALAFLVWRISARSKENHRVLDLS